MSETPSVVSTEDAARVAELEKEVTRLGHEVRLAERVRIDLKACYGVDDLIGRLRDELADLDWMRSAERMAGR